MFIKVHVYDILEVMRVILSMFELAPTWSNYTFGEIVMLIWENIDQMWLCRG